MAAAPHTRRRRSGGRDRGYGQYCALARALDVVGDRWTLLIVRELLARGPIRYTDLRSGLPDIASNLLAERLRHLESSGIVERRKAPPPIGAALIGLTARGEALRPVLHAIGRWGAPLLGEYRRTDAFRCHWLVLPLELLLTDRHPDRPPLAIEVRCSDGAVTVETGAGGLHVRPGGAVRPALVLTGPPDVVLGVMTGRLTPADAAARGLRHAGDVKALRRFMPAGGTRRRLAPATVR